MSAPSGTSQNRSVVIAAVAAAAVLLSIQLLIPPIVGLGNNGDFERSMGWAGLDYLSGNGPDTFVSWMLPRYAIVPFAWRPSNYWTSETPLVAAAVLASRAFPNGGIFDVRFLGGLHIALLLIAIGALVASCRPLSPAAQWLAAGLLVFFFTDVGYAASLNSLYSQNASLLFLLLTAAAAALAIRRGRLDDWLLLGYFGFAVLFVGSKPQESVQGPLLAVFGASLAGSRLGRWWRQPAVLLAIALCLFSVAYYRRTPAWLRPVALYDALFRELLTNSPDPALDLRDLKLDPGLLRYVNTSPYPPESPLHDPAFAKAFVRDFNYRTLLGFYLAHPRRLASLLERGSQSAFHLRPLGLGNFAKERGLPPGAMATRFAWWSDFRLALTAHALLWLGVLFGGNLAVAVAGYRRASLRGRDFRRAVILLVVMAGLEFLVVVLADEMGDVARKLFVFHALCDLLLIADAAWLAQVLASRSATRSAAAGAPPY